MEISKFKCEDGKVLFIRRWIAEEERAVVLLAHGMAEHGARYNEFAEFLNSQGLTVYAPDHRGHGKTAESDDEYGFFATKNGWSRVTDDLKELLNMIRQEHSKQKVFLFGHSMGSLLLRTLIIRYPKEYDGVILSGTAGNPGFIGKIGWFIAYMQVLIKGPKGRAPLMDKLSFGNFNSAFNDAKTDFDWLTRDVEIVQKYIEDPRCGGVFTTSFYKDLIEATFFINKPSQIDKMNKKTPILFISGSEDPVGGENAIPDIASIFREKGINTDYKLYDSGRHEILNELNKEDVYRDVITWIETIL